MLNHVHARSRSLAGMQSAVAETSHLWTALLPAQCMPSAAAAAAGFGYGMLDVLCSAYKRYAPLVSYAPLKLLLLLLLLLPLTV
jgi:hypothetical protein